MPPKRIRSQPQPTEPQLQQQTSTSTSTDQSTQENPPKKQRLNDSSSHPIATTSSSTPSAPSVTSNLPTSSNFDDDANKPDCPYGEKCYRKNPLHFKEYKHPKPVLQRVQLSNETASVSSQPQTSQPPTPSKPTLSSDQTEFYSSLLKEALLGKFKISTDEKRLLRNFRNNNSISDEIHTRLLKNYGWTPGEYEDGAKEDDGCELGDEERKILNDPNGYAIIRITKENAEKKKEYSYVFSKVCTQFYQTMSKSQSNYNVKEVGVIINSKLHKKFLDKKAEFGHGDRAKETWAFHGSSPDSIKKISQTGFLHPDELKQEVKKKSGKSKKEKPVELLDDGYFGKGIYFTHYADYALWYSEERESNQILLVKLLPGTIYKCHKRMDGKGCKKGYDSHSSPKENEIVVFQPAQTLPRYIITFESKEAEEREQES